MPATAASAIWNTGRRACAFLLLVVLPAASQTSVSASADHPGRVSRITLESDGASIADQSFHTEDDNGGHRLSWRSEVNSVQKVSVSAPRVPGLWIRLICDLKKPENWKFVTLETGRPRDLLYGSARSRISVWLQYDFLDSSFRQEFLPVVFTLTEG